MLGRGQEYFTRSGSAQPDGRAFGERTLQAVNLIAANVNSYRQLAGALASAEPRTVITITERITVPKTLKVSVPYLTIQCKGRGALVPADEGIILFSFDNIEGCVVDGVNAYANELGQEFLAFVEFISTFSEDSPGDFKNITVKNCYAVSTTFIGVPAFTGVKAFNFDFDNNQYLYNWVRFKSYATNNIHSSVVEGVPFPGAGIGESAKFGVSFIDGFPYNWNITNNATEGIISVNGAANIISHNIVGGFFVDAGNPYSVFSDSSGFNNIITSNVLAFDPLVNASSLFANNSVL